MLGTGLQVGRPEIWDGGIRMKADNSNVESTKQACGILLILGAVACMIPFFTLVSYAFKGESPHALLYVVRNLAFISGFIAIGIGVLKDKHELFPIGLFINAAASLLDVYFPLIWINSDAEYYESFSRALGGGNFLLLLCYFAEIAGFLLMGILFSKKAEWQFPQIRSASIACIAAYIALTLVCVLYYTSEFEVSIWEFVSSYITGSNALTVVGAIGVLLMPFAFPEEIPQADSIDKDDIARGTNQSGQPNATVTTQGTTNDDWTTQLLKYKELLDEGILTEEEFNKKKQELLK